MGRGGNRAWVERPFVRSEGQLSELRPIMTEAGSDLTNTLSLWRATTWLLSP
jgi:hypothetical protein